MAQARRTCGLRTDSMDVNAVSDHNGFLRLNFLGNWQAPVVIGGAAEPLLFGGDVLGNEHPAPATCLNGTSTPQHAEIGRRPWMLDCSAGRAEEVEHKAVAFDVMKHLRAGFLASGPHPAGRIADDASDVGARGPVLVRG